MTFKSRITNIAGIVMVLVLWQIAGASLGPALLATPRDVAPAVIERLYDPVFWSALWQTIWQMLLGYGLALLVGIPLGVAMGRNPIIEAIVKPWASMFIVVSAAALVPLFLIVLGRGVIFTVAIVFVITLWYVVLTMTEAARAVSPRLINVARSFSATDFQRFWMVIVPALHPYVMIAARIGVVHALRAIVTAEMFISTGFGHLLNDAGLDLSTASLFGLIVILMALSMSITASLGWISSRTAPWYASRLTRG